MAGSAWGTLLIMTTWGESHGKGLGVVVDGCPAGLKLCEEDIQNYLDRRKPGQSRFATQRREADQAEILSGVFEGRTTGTPIFILVRNTDQRSHDYSRIKDIYRPGHADYTFDEKYGFRDYRGGGRSSGRETVGRVAAGAVAAKLLENLGVTVTAYTRSIGRIAIDYGRLDLAEAGRNRVCMPDREAALKAEAYLEELMERRDSAGGVIECVVNGLPAGIGEPVFEKLDARLAHAIMSIGAVKGVEIGDGFRAAERTGSENNDGFRAAERTGSENNDGFRMSEGDSLGNDDSSWGAGAAGSGADTDSGKDSGGVVKTSNHAGGILGGISDGSRIVLRAAFKPTPSIGQLQQTVNSRGENVEISIGGRHDPIIVPRAVVVVEAMAAFTVADMLLTGMSSRLDRVQAFWGRSGSLD